LGGLKINIAEGNLTDLPTSTSKLSILIGMDSFDYMVVDESNRILVFKSYALGQPISAQSYSEFECFFRMDPLLNRSYQEQIITSCAAYYTLVPKKLFRAKATESYLHQVTDLSERYLIQSDTRSSDQMVNVFGLHHFLAEWISERFPEAIHTHSMSQLVKLGDRHHSAAENRLYLYLSGHRLMLLLWRHDHLHYSNIFTVYEEAQLIYYIGLLFNQFPIKQTNTMVYYLGGLHPDHHFYKPLNLYLDQPVLLGPPQPIRLSSELARVPANLLTLPAVAAL
jgi:hypothetical protein